MSAGVSLLSIHEADITPELCRRCAKCCEIDIAIPSVDPRRRMYFRGVGLNISPPPKDGKDDCCDQTHDVTLHLGPCTHLKAECKGPDRLYTCALFDDARRPRLCEDYNCVSWAKVHDQFNLSDHRLAAAQAALEALSNSSGRE